MSAQTSRAGRGLGSARWTRVLLYGVLIACALLYLMPVYVLLVTGLKSFEEVSLSTMWNLPSGFSIDSFVKAWTGGEAAEGFGGGFRPGETDPL